MPAPRWLNLGTLLLAVLFALAWTRARATAYPVTPPAAACTVAAMAPQTLSSIVRGEIASPVATPIVATPVNQLTPQVEQAIAAAIEQSVACVNANKTLAALTLFTDRYLKERFSGSGADDLIHVLAIAFRTPTPAEPIDMLTIQSIGAFNLEAGGRVSVTVITSNADQQFTDRLILVETRAGWLIDARVGSRR